MRQSLMRSLAALIVTTACALGVTTGTAAASPAGPARPADSYTGQIQQRGGNGFCLGTQGGGTAAGTAAIIWPCNGNPDQQWTVEDRGTTGTYKIFNGSGKCLGNLGDTNKQEATLIIWPCNNNKDQVWTVGLLDGTTASTVSNGWGLCMSTYRQGTAGGTFATQRTCAFGSLNQEWYINVPFF
jgi:hypothetical protein